jgi:hypothetical protein
MARSNTMSEFSGNGDGVYGEASSASRSICDCVYRSVVIVCVRGDSYPTRLAAFCWSRSDCRLGETGDFALDGKGELRRILWRDLFRLYGALTLVPIAT